MHSNQPYFPFKSIQSLPNQSGYYIQNDPTSLKHYIPFNNFNFQQSDACPKNLIIFDQTNYRSQIMFHPETTTKFILEDQDNIVQNDDAKMGSSLKEDSDDIDALLSTEYDEADDDDDEVSTARTSGVYSFVSQDSCSNYESLSGKSSGSRFKKSCGVRDDGKKRKRMKKMVKALRGIVPGANRMSNLVVLDEAVRYLKSLRMEVKKMGSD